MRGCPLTVRESCATIAFAKRVAANIFMDISARESAAISSLMSPSGSCRKRMLGGKQEVALATRVNNNSGGVTPLDARYVSRSEDTARQDPINPANEVPFLVTASELRDRKIKRRPGIKRRTKPSESTSESKCPACNGTGYPVLTQPMQPGRKIYPAACKKCGGKGRIKGAAN
jgi:hypothetical protein